MAAPAAQAAPAAASHLPQLVFVDGDFNELAQEMADYLHVGDEVKPLLTEKIEPGSPKKDEVLVKLVRAAPALLSVSEKEFTASSNLLIHLVLQSTDPKKHLPSLCGTFSKPLTSSHVHGVGLSMGALTTVFNLLDQKDPIRFNVFMAILRFLKQHSMFDVLEPYAKNLPQWFEAWGTGEDSQRQMYEEIAEVAAEAGNEE
jgi:translation initiation factor 3 subunit M